MIDYDKLLTYNTDITYAFHGKITECDIREASLQIADRFHYLPDDVIDELKLLSKKDRVVRVGNIQKENPHFSEQYYSKLREIRRHFISTNKLTDENVISLHSDALFINSKKRLKMIIDDIEFKSKHRWTSYIRYNSIEMFYNDDDNSITYKGITDKLLQLHTIGLCRHILKVFQMIENNDERIFHYLSDYQSKYLQHQLNDNCYIPFGRVNGEEFKENLKLLSYLTQIAIKEC